jgi:hypothetical protein
VAKAVHFLTQNAIIMVNAKTYFNYSDSLAGAQDITFDTLEEAKEYIENFEAEGDSIGVIYEQGNPTLEYRNEGGRITWREIE